VKRRQVVNEMLTTEQSYVDVLLLLEQVTEPVRQDQPRTHD
jgi:hypothetical protein